MGTLSYAAFLLHLPLSSSLWHPNNQFCWGRLRGCSGIREQSVHVGQAPGVLSYHQASGGACYSHPHLRLLWGGSRLGTRRGRSNDGPVVPGAACVYARIGTYDRLRLR